MELRGGCWGAVPVPVRVTREGGSCTGVFGLTQWKGGVGFCNVCQYFGMGDGAISDRRVN